MAFMSIGGQEGGIFGSIRRANENLSRNFQRLGSGKRINSGADDAAGLSIATKLLAQTTSQSQAGRNIADGLSMANVADGAMSQQADMLVRMRELAVQSANGTLSDSDRAALQDEHDALSSEVTRIAKSTDFNGMKPLEGESVNIQAGTGNGAEDTVNMSTQATDASTLGLDGVDISTQAGAQNALADIDAAITQLSDARGDVGAATNRLAAAANNMAQSHVNTSAAYSRIADANVAEEASGMARNSLQLRASMMVAKQSNFVKGLMVNLLA